MARHSGQEIMYDLGLSILVGIVPEFDVPIDGALVVGPIRPAAGSRDLVASQRPSSLDVGCGHLLRFRSQVAKIWLSRANRLL
jgi:hypothetical protein